MKVQAIHKKEQILQDKLNEISNASGNFLLMYHSHYDYPVISISEWSSSTLTNKEVNGVTFHVDPGCEKNFEDVVKKLKSQKLI